MRKILVVDDDTATCGLLEEALSIAGFRVQTANDGQAALELLAQEGGWTILLDLEMPIMSGQAVIHQLQADTLLGDHNQVVLMSGNHLLALAERRSAPGIIKAVLLKPFDLDALWHLVARLETPAGGDEQETRALA